MDYDVIVVGAGVGGLTSAFILSRQGKKVLLIDRQPIPGGYATTFKRKGFVFESSAHCVDSLGADGEIRKFLDENGISGEVGFIGLDTFARLIYPEHDFIAASDRDDFIRHLKDKFPRENTGIDRLFRDMDRFFRQFDLFAKSDFPIWIKYLLMPFLCPKLIKISRMSVKDYIGNYVKDDKLFALVTDIWRFTGLPPGRLSALYFLLVFRGYYYGPTCYIKGGVARLFEAMAEQIHKNGSQTIFNRAVTKIIMDKDGKVATVVTDKGEEFRVKAVISNANAIDTLTRLIDDETVKQYYRKKLSPLEKSISAFQVYLGLKVPAKTLGMNHYLFSVNTTYNHEENFRHSFAGEYDRCSLEIVDHSRLDPALAPEGKGTLLITTLDNYFNWKDLSEEEYNLKKQKAADILISRVNKLLPGLSDNIELMEVATPRTMEHFTLSPEGAIYGFAQTVEQSGIFRLEQQTRVKGLYLAGAWTQPGGGIHACFVSGMEAAEMVTEFLKGG